MKPKTELKPKFKPFLSLLPFLLPTIPSLTVPPGFLSFSFSLILTGSAAATVVAGGVTVVGEAGLAIGRAGALNTKSSFSFEGAGLRDEGAGLGEAPPTSDPESPPPLSESSSSSSLSAPEETVFMFSNSEGTKW